MVVHALFIAVCACMFAKGTKARPAQHLMCRYRPLTVTNAPSARGTGLAYHAVMARICTSCLRSLPNRCFWVVEHLRQANGHVGRRQGYLADICGDCRKRH
ncbi:MAG: hypothetical protein QOJ23_10 [Actinomycetota bacterium]|nr:hypothetical protein [Actinomycetota bacterium]MDQ1501330.1 hypothetical protein [Actinomycetota bacterium]